MNVKSETDGKGLQRQCHNPLGWCPLKAETFILPLMRRRDRLEVAISDRKRSSVKAIEYSGI